jgi:CBS domain-containing protein/sporulation protein YlmC with PRC-barrel domain
MPFLSELVHRPVRDGRGELVGKCTDVYVDPVEGFPAVVAIGLHRQNGDFLIAAVDISELDHGHIVLRERLRDLAMYEAHGDEIGLARQVLDRQIIDVHGRRVVRVHDLQLTRTNGHYRLVGIDATPRAMLRRLGLEGPAGSVLRLLGRKEALGDGCIPWSQLDPVAIGPAGIPLKTDHAALGRMHPADLADIVEQLDQAAGGYLLATLDAETAADVMEEVEQESQAGLIEQLDTERAADILELMPPDEAADLLADLPEGRAAELLARMEPGEAADVRELLSYPEDTAGGRMTTDLLMVSPDITAAQAVDRIRETAEVESYYIYVTEPDETLLGVFSLRDLIVAISDTPVREFMTTPVISVTSDTPQAEVAAVLTIYDLLAVPVTDDDHHILGIVTVDDVLDVLLPAGWKKNLPKLY